MSPAVSRCDRNEKRLTQVGWFLETAVLSILLMLLMTGRTKAFSPDVVPHETMRKSALSTVPLDIFASHYLYYCEDPSIY
jgi:hypothetical protein